MLDLYETRRETAANDMIYPLRVPPPALDADLADTRTYEVPSLLRRLLRQQQAHWFAALAIAELSLLILAVTLAVQTCNAFGLRTAGFQHSWLLVSTAWTAMIALGLYQRHAQFAREARIGTAARVVVALAAGAIVVLSWELLRGEGPGTGMLGFSLGYAAILLTLSRIGFARLAGDTALRRQTLVLGAGARAAELLHRLNSSDDSESPRSIRLVGFVTLPTDSVALVDPRRIHLRSGLAEYAREHEIDEIVIAADERRRTLPMSELVNCRLAGIEVLDLEAFCEREFGKTTLELMLPSWCVFTSAFDTSALRRISKRGFDLCASFAMLALGWPVMLTVAAAILIEARGKGPVLYAQERVGRNGEIFRLYKFRSMRTDAERDGVARWAQSNDDRVTRVGRVIRKFRLDELPQLWNVLRGEMSIVGPRPERPPFVEQFKHRVPYYNLRHCVRPGLTGWAQLRFPYGASEEDAAEKLRYDLYYVKYQSLSFDLLILLQTVDVVLFGRGGR
jgi:sugar transferase (PEP-CTERM system associated)